MRVSVKADYAVRAAVELAAAYGKGPVAAEQISEIQNIPLKFLHNILAELKQGGIVKSQRGAGGGFVLGRDPEEVTLGDIIRVTDGPLARVGDYRPDELAYSGHTAALRDVWVAVRVGIRDVLDEVTVAAVNRGELPEVVHDLLERPDAWLPRIKLDPQQQPRTGVPGRGVRSVERAGAKAAVARTHRSAVS
ncbi:MAG: Rrf2 family transcriptional regulator [Candidatus Dormibacteria bacterium]|jgi:Rrf2 family protein